MINSVSTTAIAFLLAFALAASGCGGSGAALEDTPDWMAEKPSSENALHGAGTGTASGLQTAIEKSRIRAQGDIASSIEAQFNSMTRDFREDVSGEELSQFTQVQEQIVSQVLRGAEAEDQKIMEEDGQYRVYTLMQMPIGEAAEQFLSRLQTNEEMYTRFRASEAFEEMQKRIKDYEENQETGAQEQN